MKLLLSILLITTSLVAEAKYKRRHSYKHKLSITTYFTDIVAQAQSLKFDVRNNESALSNNIKNLEKLNIISKELKEFSNKFAADALETIQDNDVLNGRELDTLSKLVDSYQALTYKYFQYLIHYKPQDKLKVHEMFPINDKVTMKKNMMWFSAQLSLFDHFMDAHDGYWKNGEIRRVVKNIFLSKRNIKGMQDLAIRVLDKKHIKMLRYYANGFQDNLTEIGSASDRYIRILIWEITHNESYSEVKNREYTSVSNHTIQDGFISFLGRITNFVSGVFGNIVGKIRWRHGYLFKNQTAHKDIRLRLKPLDLLVEKTPFALTDTFIPGHFGHIAIWLGTEEQLKEHGLWDLPAIRPIQDKIRQGYVIAEAVRPGVRLTKFEHFMQVDELAILRDRELLRDKELVNSTVTIALKQIGKDYDFNFDVATTDKIVCSELIFMALGHIDWPTEYIWGRNTISPDNVTELAFYENSPINIEFHLYAKKKGKLQRLTVKDMADRLNYVINEENSTEDTISFDKKIKKCRWVRKKRPFGERYENVRVCTTKYKHYVYEGGQKDQEWLKWYGPKDAQ